MITEPKYPNKSFLEVSIFKKIFFFQTPILCKPLPLQKKKKKKKEEKWKENKKNKHKNNKKHKTETHFSDRNLL